MPLKNYTSQVPARQSIEFIERKLVANKATHIMKQYDDQGRVSSVLFIISIDGNELTFKLPARVAECEKVIMAMLPAKARPDTMKKIPAQAERTAWKILSDWVEAQMAMLELAQVEFLEIFLPYAYNHASDKTYFETLKERGFKELLADGKGSRS